MAVISAPNEPGVQAGWMRQALLVVALAGSGEEGAEPGVTGASLWPMQASRGLIPPTVSF